MSWAGDAQRDLELEEFRDWKVDEAVLNDLGRLANVLYIRQYIGPGAAKLTQNELGSRIDDGLVEYLYLNLRYLRLRGGDVEDFQSFMRGIDGCRSESPALMAFRESQLRDEGLPLASDLYFNFAMWHINQRSIPRARRRKRRPLTEGGRQFVRVKLRPFMDPSVGETDWNIEVATSQKADSWLRDPSSHKLLRLIYFAKRSPVDWDTLKKISENFEVTGQERHPLLLHWYSQRAEGLRPRPAEGPAPRHRRGMLGDKLRNNEIKHTVNLLYEVGFFKSHVHRAVAKHFSFSPEFIRDIGGDPYFTVDELREDAMKRLEPNFHSHVYGPGSDFTPSG